MTAPIIIENHDFTVQNPRSPPPMRKSNPSRFVLEALEDRALLSHLASDASVVSASTIAPPKSASSPANVSSVGAMQQSSIVNSLLQGTTSGTYTVTPGVASGTTYTLSGSGKVNTMGGVQITGAIQSKVSGDMTQLSGTLTLTDSQGSIQLSVQWTGRQPLAPVGSGGTSTTSPPSNLLHYTILSGTGAFKSMRGAGAASLALLPPIVTVNPPLSRGAAVTLAPPTMPTYLHGTFILSFNAGVVAGPTTA